jgi:hypothetical protein
VCVREGIGASVHNQFKLIVLVYYEEIKRELNRLLKI